jgi:hypothetical protein
MPMPPQSRSQRRRQAARQQGRPANATSTISAEATSRAPSIDEAAPLASPAPPVAPRPARNNSARRVISRAAPEPVDYTSDYAAVRVDLRWIAIWAALLFIAMIALRFSGLV